LGTIWVYYCELTSGRVDRRRNRTRTPLREFTAMEKEMEKLQRECQLLKADNTSLRERVQAQPCAQGVCCCLFYFSVSPYISVGLKADTFGMQVFFRQILVENNGPLCKWD